MSDCIIFPGYKDALGYGAKRYRGRVEKAHRVAWMEARGPIPEGMHVLHRCDVRACVKLSAEAVRRIREAMARKTDATAKELAAEYGVSVETIYAANNERHYRWVA